MRIRQKAPIIISPAIKFNHEGRTNTSPRNAITENIYQDDFISVTPELRETFIQPADFNTNKYPQNKFRGNNYRLSGDGFLI
jgi:hypothetical protein